MEYVIKVTRRDLSNHLHYAEIGIVQMTVLSWSEVKCLRIEL